MSWSAAPTLPERKTGPAWTTAAALPVQQRGVGWFTARETVVPFSAVGAFTANVATSYPFSTARFSSVGTLSATIRPIKPVTAQFAATGQLIGDVATTGPVTVAFTATGTLGAAINDGLSGIVIGGISWVDGLSADVGYGYGSLPDGLSAAITPVVGGAQARAANFTATGVFAPILTGSQMAEGWLTATVTAATGGWGSQERMLAETTPVNTFSGDYTIGAKFTPTANGRITHVHCWLSGGTHTFTIWNTTSTRLGTITTAVVGNTWHEVALPTPVNVVAGTYYVVSVSTDGGGYGYNTPWPTSAAAHLTDFSGCYQNGSDIFPSIADSNYHYVDVVYQQAL